MSKTETRDDLELDKLSNTTNPFACEFTDEAKEIMRSLVKHVDGRTWKERVDSINKKDGY
ncbi:hypothetical protein NB550_11105 [Vibrio parahaemolyticus]|uniref:hypothetical protein n=1 Tax=Vibrio TaxID=662 RepID=UPI0015D14435|nr:hypothetical protein [Vibrio parahaemolyticus]MCR9888107.1 hypothetical protein [Vibrio parahaemolyticus]MCR9918037.1 hypothetical protein [Vibrio parahaemolyticus]NYU23867.1 hypothetical protein [Vibrio parahaemolyticus]WHT06072.1 hypothetical protein O2T11_25830 [Vibrio parahaemolyticus]